MKRVRFLRRVGLLEGASYVLLLFIAMPLKYLLDQPMAVRITGIVHGGLFILLLYALVLVIVQRRWPPQRSLLVLGAALIPLGPWFIDRMLRREMEAEEGVLPDE